MIDDKEACEGEQGSPVAAGPQATIPRRKDRAPGYENFSRSLDSTNFDRMRRESPQHRSEQRLMNHIRTTVSNGMSSSALIQRPDRASANVQSLSQSVSGEAEAFRTEVQNRPVDKAAARVHAWGCEQPDEAASGQEQVRSQTSSEYKGIPSPPASKHAIVNPRNKAPAVVTSGGSRGGNWGMVRPPVSPGQSPVLSPGVPALSIGHNAHNPSNPNQQPSKQPVITEEQDDDSVDMCWAVAKYALVLGGSLYIGNKLHGRFTGSSSSSNA